MKDNTEEMAIYWNDFLARSFKTDLESKGEKKKSVQNFFGQSYTHTFEVLCFGAEMSSHLYVFPSLQPSFILFNKQS